MTLSKKKVRIDTAHFWLVDNAEDQSILLVHSKINHPSRLENLLRGTPLGNKYKILVYAYDISGCRVQSVLFLEKTGKYIIHCNG